MGMNAETKVLEKKQKTGKLFVPAVVLPFLVTFLSNGILILLLSDITKTFFGSVTPGTLGLAGQLSTFNSLAEAVAAFLIGVLAIKFRHKPLFVAGILCIAISAVGNFLAPSFVVMEAFFALEGAGSVIVTVVGLSLIGDAVPAKNRSKTVGYSYFTFYLSAIIGPPIAGYLASLGGWRFSFLFYAIPIAVIALVLANWGIPKKLPNEKEASLKVNYVTAIKSVISNRSAVVCLLSQLLLVGSIVGMYVLTLFQLNAGLTTFQSVIILMASGGTIGLGGLFASRIVDRFGKKRSAITFFLIDAILLTAVFQTTDLLSGIILNELHVFIIGAAATSLNCLSLEQIPQSRSTMMSLTSLFGKIGNTIAAATASFLLLTFGSYSIMGFVFGAMTLITTVTLLFTKEPKASLE
jgi:predicted MFS family arabinose efflux permease